MGQRVAVRGGFRLLGCASCWANLTTRRGTPSSRATTSTSLAALAPGSVDLVYADPPYNTGNDFAYADRFRDASHADPCAGRHAAWAAMMRPRLVALREVLAPHGAVFVSIDDNEAAHLRLLMDEVFGEANFLAQIVVNLNPKGRQLGARLRHQPRVRPRLRPRPRASAPSTRSTRRDASTRTTSR